MTALIRERNTEYFGAYPARRTLPVNGGATIYKGAMVAIDSSGNAIAATLAAGGAVRIVGAASFTIGNSAGSDGDYTIDVLPGIHKFVNYGSDLVTDAEVGAVCYCLDDQTVAKTSSTGARIECGIVQQVDSDGVRVLIA